MPRFRTDTAVEALGGGRYGARMDPGWWIVRGPNGGYVAATVLRALTEAVGEPARAPRSLTVHYLSPPVEGPVEIGVTVERSGRTLDTLSARLIQQGRVRAIALAAYATERSGPGFQDIAAPSVPSPDAVPAVPAQPGDIPMRARYDTRWVIGSAGFDPTDPAAPAEVGGWIRLADDEPVDHHVVAAFTDAWLPAVFMRLPDRNPVPTVDLTVHFREPPPDRPCWCFVRFRTSAVMGGFLEEDGEVWSEDGRLLAQSRQLGVLLDAPA